jgi:hypothetical protein
MRRVFDCGHKGQGKFCHRCSNDQKAVLAVQALAEEREARRAAAAAKPRQRKEPPAKDPAEAERIRALKAAAAGAPIDLSAAESLPAVMERALDVLTQLDAGTHPLSLGGQKLTSRRGYFSVPVGLRHRIFVDAYSLKPTEFLSHEAYNGFV